MSESDTNSRIVDLQLLKFHPIHQIILDRLLSQDVGLFNKKYTIKKIDRCGQNVLQHDREKQYADMFLLTIPVCGDEKLEWQVILNEFKPSMRPDLKVYHPGFSQYLVANLIRSGLFHYNAEDKAALLTLVERLKKMYYEYVMCSLDKSSLAYQNISRMLDMFGPETQYEIFQSRGLVHISLPLQLDLSRVQLTLPSSECSVTLTLTSPYPHEADGKYDTRLHMSLDLRDQLNIDQFKQPKFSRDKPMLAFVRQLTAHLQGHIHNVATMQLLRKRYLLACVALARSAVIGWDAIHFRSGTFLLSSQYKDSNYCYLLRLRLDEFVSYDLVSVYNSRVLGKGKARLETDPRDLFGRVAKDGNVDRACLAVRGLVEKLLEMGDKNDEMR